MPFCLTKDWRGKWPYSESAGVGLKLVGRPTNRRRLIELMQEKSCNPIASRRIADTLEAGRPYFTTLRAQFDFEDLKAMFASVGVRMTVRAPVAVKRINNQLEDQRQLLEDIKAGKLTADELGPYRWLAES